MNQWKDGILTQLAKGLEQLAARRGIEIVHGHATFTGSPAPHQRWRSRDLSLSRRSSPPARDRIHFARHEKSMASAS